MMRFKILYTQQFLKEFEKLDRFFQRRIKEKFDEVAQNPERYKHLHHELAGSNRIRIGKFRVVFSYDVSKQELYLEKVVFGHRY